MRKVFILLLCCWIYPVMAQNLDDVIIKLKQDVPGRIVTPATTKELAELFKGSTDLTVPRVFVDKLPADFAKKGTPELYTQIITALILRSNEQAIREKMILTASNFGTGCIKNSRSKKLKNLCELCLSASLREKPMR